MERGAIASVEQVFMLTNAELDAVRQRPDLFHDLLADRWRRFKALFDLEPPFVVVDRHPAQHVRSPRGPGHRARGAGHGLDRSRRRRWSPRAGPASCSTRATPWP